MKIEKIIFGIGSNLGDRNKFIESAIIQLEEMLFLKNIKKSRIIENPAMLLKDSPNEWNKSFLNIVIAGEINFGRFSHLQILEIVKKIEKNLGRKDRARWAPREIDIDILAIGKWQIKIGNKLIIPHIGLFERDFFKDGFCEIEQQLFDDLHNLQNEATKLENY